SEAIVDMGIAALNPSAFSQALPECGQAPFGFRIVLGKRDQGADARCRARLLPPRHQRPCRRTAEPCDERAPLHSMTSSERACKLGGMSNPCARAVLRLITISNVVGRTTGRSAGFAPFKIRPT